MQLFKNFISNNNSETEKDKDKRKTRTNNNPARNEESVKDNAKSS